MTQYNGGQWTEARFSSFIKSALRAASMKWPPRNAVKKNARVGWGKYKCAGCGKIVGPTKKVGKKTQHNIFVDHIKPVIDPKRGFISWDEVIKRLFCEEDGMQLLCAECHDAKTKKERGIAARRRKKKI